MKKHSNHLTFVTFAVSLLALGTFCPDLHAGWGSLQANNRSAPRAQPARPAPAPRPVARPEAPRPEAARPERPVARPENPGVREQPGFANQSRPQPVYHTPAGETDRRRMDIDGDRRQSYFWSDYHPGMRIDRLPDGYRRFGLRGHDYFYFGGVFYDGGSSGYVVVAPPIDADVPDLPPGAETIQGPDGNIYYYGGGAFYIQASDGYEVVAPPLGVTVSDLPPGATATVINGLTYYQAYGVWYQPVFENGVTAYLTVPQPG
jgi:hypothetical protein